MQGTITYVGQIPSFSFKMAWSPNQSLTLQEFHSHVLAAVKRDIKDEQDFLIWLSGVVEGKEFSIDISEDVQTTESEDIIETTSAPKKRGRPKKTTGTVTVETSKVETSSNLAAARNKLKRMGHPDEVGTTERESGAGNKVKPSIAQEISNFEKTMEDRPVITGDMLAKARGKEITSSHQTRSSHKSNIHVMDSHGNAVTRVPTSKEEQAEANAKLANLSGKTRVLTLEEGSEDSYINTGNQTENPSSTKKDNQERPGKVNKYLQSHGGTANVRVITIQDFIEQKDEKEVQRLIGLCKDTTTLKMAMAFYRENGNHRLIEKIEMRLQRLPKFS